MSGILHAARVERPCVSCLVLLNDIQHLSKGAVRTVTDTRELPNRVRDIVESHRG